MEPRLIPTKVRNKEGGIYGDFTVITYDHKTGILKETDETVEYSGWHWYLV